MKNSKVRNLTKTLAVVSLLAPAGGHALGIGEIKLHSALNQNLDAEISLTLSGESVSDIKVNLAPPEKFDEAGVSWNYFLSKIKFETITHSNGAAVIKLTSKEALKEPFLDFLLEVSWPKGNLYREFTVLVDPPTVYNQATIPVSTGTGTYAQPPAAATPHANGQSSEGEYGPTLENDTLWSVADRVRGGEGDVSVEQMLVAIYKANPHAFYKGNVYALTAGKMLKIPDRGAVLKLSRNQALAEFNRHTKAWKNHSSPFHDTAKEKPTPSKAEKPLDNQLTLDAPTKAAVTDHAVVEQQVSAEKKIADASSVKGKIEQDASKTALTDGAIQGRIAELEKQLAMMKELIALKDQQLAALQNQSQANRAVQGQTPPSEVVAAKPADQAAPAPQQAVAQPVPTPQQAVVQPAPSGVVTAKPETQTTPAQQPVVVKPPQPVIQPRPAVQPEPEAQSLLDPYYLGVGGVGAAILTLLGWLWWRKRKVDEETNTESMFATTSLLKTPEADESLSVPVVEDSAAAIVHDAGTVGESSFLSEFTPSDFDSFDTDQGEIDPISEADVYLAYGRYQQAEELIRQAISDQPNRDECKLKLLEIFYANENKTAFEAYANELAEAGKRNEAEFWEKAAEMGREICPDSPLFSSGDDLFAVADDSFVENVAESVVRDEQSVDAGASSFVDTASEDADLASSEPKGNPLAESNPLIDEQRNNADIDFDLGSFSMGSKVSDDSDKGVIAPGTPSGASSGMQTEGLDFDLGSFSIDSKEPDKADKGVIAPGTPSGAPSGMQTEDLDFDLGSFSIDSKEPDKADKGGIAPGTPIGASSGMQTEDLDFDLGSFSIDSKVSDDSDKGVIAPGTPTGASSGMQTEDLDFDLGSFSIDSKVSDDSDKGVIAPGTPTGASSEMQTEDLDFDLGSFSMDTKESDEADKDAAVSSALSDMASGTPGADKKQEFESLEFELGPDKVETIGIDDFDFSSLKNDDRSQQDIDFSTDMPLELNDDLGGDFDFNFDLDIPSAATEQSFNQDVEFGVSDLTDMDELETKLDLAKAYVDMGDADAAKDIAREVLEQGTAEQKKIAQALLDELD